MRPQAAAAIVDTREACAPTGDATVTLDPPECGPAARSIEDIRVDHRRR
jgi:hypothetical protein